MQKYPFKNSLLRRVKISVVILAVIYVIMVAAIMLPLYAKNFYRRMLQQKKYEDQIAVDGINRLIRTVERSANDMILMLNVPNDAKGSILSEGRTFLQRRKRFQEVMAANLIQYPEIARIYLILDSGESFSLERSGMYSAFFSGEASYPFAAEQETVTAKGEWLPLHPEQSGPCFCKKLSRIDDSVRMGFLVLEADGEALDGVLDPAWEVQGAEGYLLDAEGGLIACSHPSFMEEYAKIGGGEQKLYFEQKVTNRRSAVWYSYDTFALDDGWTLVSVLDKREGMKGMVIVIRYTLIFTPILICLLIAVISKRLHRALQPLVQLSDHMKEEKSGNLSRIDLPVTDDEIGYLLDNYNRAVERNQKLIEQIMHNEEEKRIYEFSLLQAQIKPHFLYNTLDTAYCLNEIGEHKESNFVIKQLADYYRSVLSSNTQKVTLAQECSALEKYINIQQIRYGDQIQFQMEIPDDLQEISVPNMILQPLVENAIYHGIKPAGRRGTIIVSGRRTDQGCELRVADDGVGMSRRQFMQILEEESQKKTVAGFGLRATVERLKLFYGDRVEIALEEQSKGTCIVICLNIHHQLT